MTHPVKIRVFLRGCDQNAAAAGHDASADQRVTRETQVACTEADAAAKCQASDTRVAYETCTQR